jgi:hypothetical protein
MVDPTEATADTANAGRVGNDARSAQHGVSANTEPLRFYV